MRILLASVSLATHLALLNVIVGPRVWPAHYHDFLLPSKQQLVS